MTKMLWFIRLLLLLPLTIIRTKKTKRHNNKNRKPHERQSRGRMINHYFLQCSRCFAFLCGSFWSCFSRIDFFKLWVFLIEFLMSIHPFSPAKKNIPSHCLSCALCHGVFMCSLCSGLFCGVPPAVNFLWFALY